jgi:sugar (pentulose or hexulose) kinase
MFDWGKRNWAVDLVQRLQLPADILPNIHLPGRIIGNLNQQVCEELRIKSVPVSAVASHDTASALMSVPSSEGTYAYLSSGTWSLLGIERSEPIISEKTYARDFTNECGYGKSTTLHKNLMGLWLMQECKKAWDKDGESLSFEQLEEDATGALPFAAFIDTDDGIFLSHGNMPDKIRDFCTRTGQKPPKTKAAVVRCILESLALKYRMVLQSLEEIVDKPIPVLHIVGGGCKNRMLCRFTANAIGRPVIAGPVEATAIGNLMCQLLAQGEIRDLEEARQMVKGSFPTTEYLPAEVDGWNDAYMAFKKICHNQM